MTSIDFYFNATDRLQVACRLVAKALALKKPLLIFAPQAELAQRVDRMLWTWPAIAFVPHCMAHDALAAETPVLITTEAPAPGPADVLLNLGIDCPPQFERFERLLEIVSQDEQERSAGRSRYRHYKGHGYPISDHDLAQEPARGE
jgi:DNA polymerase-3 subunit chi